VTAPACSVRRPFRRGGFCSLIPQRRRAQALGCQFGDALKAVNGRQATSASLYDSRDYSRAARCVWLSVTCATALRVSPWWSLLRNPPQSQMGTRD
jgi:hypothetical protein